MRAPPAFIAALAALAGGCGAPESGVRETPLYADAGAGADDGAGGDRPAAVADAIARWDAAGAGAAAPGEEAAACLSGAAAPPLSGDAMVRILGGAIEGLLSERRFVESRVRTGLWEGDVLKVNAAEDDGRGGRKIWLGDGQLERRVERAGAAGGPRRITVRSSVENPQLVADGASGKRRDVVVLEVAARWTARGTEAIVLVDPSARLASVVRKAGGDWRFVRAVDLAGIDDTPDALCRAVTAQ